MRIKKLMALAIAVLAFGLMAPKEAEAFGRERSAHPSGWGNTRVVQHYYYRPRYEHRYSKHSATDPYAYRYQPKGYYPYYNSGYWGHKRAKRQHFHKPPYYQAWGGPKKHYKHRKWHQSHHGGHRRSDY